jgi:tetratricopeptide (TPR) repeat protein
MENKPIFLKLKDDKTIHNIDEFIKQIKAMPPNEIQDFLSQTSKAQQEYSNLANESLKKFSNRDVGTITKVVSEENGAVVEINLPTEINKITEIGKKLEDLGNLSPAVKEKNLFSKFFKRFFKNTVLGKSVSNFYDQHTSIASNMENSEKNFKKFLSINEEETARLRSKYLQLYTIKQELETERTGCENFYNKLKEHLDSNDEYLKISIFLPIAEKLEGLLLTITAVTHDIATTFKLIEENEEIKKSLKEVIYNLFPIIKSSSDAMLVMMRQSATLKSISEFKTAGREIIVGTTATINNISENSKEIKISSEDMSAMIVKSTEEILKLIERDCKHKREEASKIIANVENIRITQEKYKKEMGIIENNPQGSNLLEEKLIRELQEKNKNQ